MSRSLYLCLALVTCAIAFLSYRLERLETTAQARKILNRTPTPERAARRHERDKTVAALRKRVEEVARQQPPEPIAPNREREQYLDAALAHLEAQVEFLQQLIYLLHKLGLEDRRQQEQVVDQALTKAEEAKRTLEDRLKEWEQTLPSPSPAPR